MEYWGERGVDLTLDDACTALGIDKEIIRSDASVQFRETDDYELSYDGYINRLKQSSRRGAARELHPHIDDLEQRVDDIVTKLTTDNPGELLVDPSSADITDREIEAITSSSEYSQLMRRQAMMGRAYEDLFHNSIMAQTEELRADFNKQKGDLRKELNIVDEELGKFKTPIKILRMKRDAEATGLALTLDQFITVLYEADVSDSPLSREWGTALAETVDQMLHELSGIDDQTTKVNEIYVGRDAFDEFKGRISAHNQIRARVEQRMELIRPAFRTEITLDNHPLLSGVGEK